MTNELTKRKTNNQINLIFLSKCQSDRNVSWFWIARGSKHISIFGMNSSNLVVCTVVMRIANFHNKWRERINEKDTQTQLESNELSKWDVTMKAEREIHRLEHSKCGKTGCCRCSLHTLNHYVHGSVWVNLYIYFFSSFQYHTQINTFIYLYTNSVSFCQHIIKTFHFIRPLSISNESDRERVNRSRWNWFVSISIFIWMLFFSLFWFFLMALSLIVDVVPRHDATL